MIRLTWEERDECPYGPCLHVLCAEHGDPDCSAEYRNDLANDAADRKIDAAKEQDNARA